MGAPEPWIPVDDPDDPHIAAFLGLRDHDLRRAREAPDGDLAGSFVAEGDLVVARALSAGYRPIAALVDATRRAPLPGGWPDAAPVFAAAPAVVLRITGMGVHRGVLAQFARRPEPGPDEVLAGSRRVVVLEHVVNPTNVGVIARSAAALGVDALLVDPTCCDPLYRRASRVAMGEVFALPWTRLGRLPAGLAPLRDHGFRLVALTPAADATPIDALDVGDGERVALLLGAEGAGLSAGVLGAADERVRIPLHGRVDSLNVGAAAAIACYELTRVGRR